MIFILGDCLFGSIKLTRLLILINMDRVVVVLDLMTLTIFMANWKIGKKCYWFLSGQ